MPLVILLVVSVDEVEAGEEVVVLAGVVEEVETGVVVEIVVASVEDEEESEVVVVVVVEVAAEVLEEGRVTGLAKTPPAEIQTLLGEPPVIVADPRSRKELVEILAMGVEDMEIEEVSAAVEDVVVVAEAVGSEVSF